MIGQLHELKDGRTYVVEILYHVFTRYGGNIYTAFGKGEYRGEYGKGPNYYYLWDVTIYLRNTNIKFTTHDDIDLSALLLNKHNQFYDIEHIRKNSKIARQKMELRALNMILKRLVNEEFEWS